MIAGAAGKSERVDVVVGREPTLLDIFLDRIL
jgi:hypothetical protein